MSSGGGGDGGAGARQAEEEQRKAALRGRIDRLYGIYEPSKTGYKIEWSRQPNGTFRGVRSDTGEEFETVTPGEPPSEAAYREGGTRQVNPGAAGEAATAKSAMEAENTKLGEATRSYYTDQLGDQYAEAERNTRFKLARQGLLGGSEDIFQQGDVKKDRDLGATRVDESVRRAIASLTGQRENERLNAVNLVNAGAGDSAISAAAAGLRNSFANAESAQKANIFTDLFANSADTVSAANTNDQQAALLARYRDRLSSFFPTGGTTSSGRVTPSA